MSRSYGNYYKFDVVYADFGKNPHGVEGGIRPGVIVSCNKSNHDAAPQVSIVPLSSKLKEIPVHVQINPEDIKGYGIRNKSDFIPENIQTISKNCIRCKTGYIRKDSDIRERLDRSMIRQLDLLSVARKMIEENTENGCKN